MKKLIQTTSAIALMAIALPAGASASDDINNIIEGGKFFGEVRYRYETVDQANIANEAEASTVRTNFGFETGDYMGFQALVEAQLVRNLGPSDFNDTVNGETTFPVVADPDTTEINEAYITYSNLPDTVVKVGRQKVNLDNQRFVGTVNWRQNDQTFDAAAIINNSIENLQLMYAYVGNVNRIQGSSHPLGDVDAVTHLANVNYDVADLLSLTGYYYDMEMKEAQGLSNKTYGVRATGKTPINDDWRFMYEAEYAEQEDSGDNTTSYDVGYYHIAPAIKGFGLTAKVGYEVLEGDGTQGFQTPLATGHKFNGWADQFLNTPANGLEDLYFMLGYKIGGTDTFFDGVTVKAFYHEFEAEETSTEYGDELDLVIGKNFKFSEEQYPFKNLNVSLKYADFEAENGSGFNDTEKFWLQIGTKF